MTSCTRVSVSVLLLTAPLPSHHLTSTPALPPASFGSAECQGRRLPILLPATVSQDSPLPLLKIAQFLSNSLLPQSDAAVTRGRIIRPCLGPRHCLPVGCRAPVPYRDQMFRRQHCRLPASAEVVLFPSTLLGEWAPRVHWMGQRAQTLLYLFTYYIMQRSHIDWKRGFSGTPHTGGRFNSALQG